MYFSSSDEVHAYCREEGPVVDLAAGAAAGVLPKLLDNRAEYGLRRQEAGSPQRPLHAGLGDVPGVEVVVVHKEGGQAQALLVNLWHVSAKAGQFKASVFATKQLSLNAGWPAGSRVALLASIFYANEGMSMACNV